MIRFLTHDICYTVNYYTLLFLNAMKIITLCIIMVSLGMSYGCSKERLNQSVFEGLKKREELKRPPNESSPMNEPMSYDEYLREREKIKERQTSD
ncbi:MAG: hypothetical protein JSW20_11580 [Nitrospiraceae bacterium]|nr:MAG: hypothetical protein JSW20_11580 [Nitrospiraceae bacterium]